MNTTTQRSATRRFAPAIAVTAVVLVSAGTGSAVAAQMITGADIKNNTVTTSDIKNGSVKGKDVKAGSLRESKLSTGVAGKLNAAALPGYQVVNATIEVPGQQTYDYLTVDCPTGKVAVGGGGTWSAGAYQDGAFLAQNNPGKLIGEFFAPIEDPSDVAQAWQVGGENGSNTPQDLSAYVICVDPS